MSALNLEPMPASPRRPILRAMLAASPLLCALLLTACGAQMEASPPPPDNTIEPAASAAAEAPGFMRIGEVQRALPPAAPPPRTTEIAADDKKTDKDKPEEKKEATKSDPYKSTGRDDGATAASASASAPPPGGLHAAVVDSAGGLSEAEVRATIVQQQASFRACYDLGVKNTPGGFSGSVALRISIGPTGAVASLDIVSSTTKNTQVDECVGDAVRRIQFPAKGGGAVVAFPIEFGK